MALLVVATALLPTDTRSLDAHPNATADYGSAMARARDFQRRDSDATTAGASLLRVHGHRTPRAFVFFHGLTNSPYQDRHLADSVFQAGDNVLVPRLPWHGLRGARTDNLSKMTAVELRDVADASVDIASGLGDSVIVFGLSLGGTVAAWVAQFRPVCRVVIAAPALGLSRVTAPLETPMMHLLLRLPNYPHEEAPDGRRPDRTLGWSTRGIGEMLELGSAVNHDAERRSRRTSDIRVLANAYDHTVNRTMINSLVASWQADGPRVHMYEFSDTLRLPHDIVDPTARGARLAVTEPVILALLYGSAPPPRLAREVVSRR